jgi:hypothetical protein
MQSFCTDSQDSPSIILEHLSPCSIESSLCDLSQETENSRAQEAANTHTKLAQEALDAITALRLQNTTLEHEQNARGTASLRVHYAPNVVSASYEVPRTNTHSDGEDTSTQETRADDSCSTHTDSEESDAEDLCSKESDAEELHFHGEDEETLSAQEFEADNSHNSTEDSLTQGDEGENSYTHEHDVSTTAESSREYDRHAESAENDYPADDETSGADSVETIRGDSAPSDTSMSDSIDTEIQTETGEDGDDEGDPEPAPFRKIVFMPKTEGWSARSSQNGRVMHVTKSDPSRPWSA